MDVFSLRDRVVGEYREYLDSFVNIREYIRDPTDRQRERGLSDIPLHMILKQMPPTSR